MSRFKAKVHRIRLLVFVRLSQMEFDTYESNKQEAVRVEHNAVYRLLNNGVKSLALSGRQSTSSIS